MFQSVLSSIVRKPRGWKGVIGGLHLLVAERRSGVGGSGPFDGPKEGVGAS
jgi:hypothetical protein